jgi:flagellar motor protein MotB
LVITVPARDFDGGTLQPAVAGHLAQVAAAIIAHPGLRVEVDDNFDGSSTGRAEAVRAALMRNGLPAEAISVRSIGESRPIATSATPAGRELNRRVEIAISGDMIGNMPYWDRSYSIVPR